MILSLDTTAEFGSVALVDSGELVEEILLHSPEGFGQILFGHIGRILERHGLRPDDIECFAAASGPGSFTGVRIGLSAAKGLAHATGRPVAGVSNLQALAWFGSAPLRACVLDARRGEIYGAVYDAGLRVVSPEVVMKFGDWLGSLPAGDVEIVAIDAAPFRAFAGEMAIIEAGRSLAGAVGQIAWLRLQAGEACDPASLDANYVRRSDAELFWRDR
ncbi:MAG TPA: tRNA (adenosine(37)-N6)-threonylcarbamoyltransferase complex dimerization subunit type 1 TsaB [Bryobacteraceae bacterium]|nr:tRNA (adenosine(37)-N6)-threonylcarbamoyltransferase complex dimerization subunit type 1 TsaB [Bryobacteraceae bacterium]